MKILGEGSPGDLGTLHEYDNSAVMIAYPVDECWKTKPDRLPYLIPNIASAVLSQDSTDKAKKILRSLAVQDQTDEAPSKGQCQN